MSAGGYTHPQRRKRRRVECLETALFFIFDNASNLPSDCSR
jgi:hypothetical protein